jgi:hypothetical protein
VKQSARGWRRLLDDRARARSEQLDALLDEAAAGRLPPDGPFRSELAAARVLAQALPLPNEQGGDELVSLRAGLAARRSIHRDIVGRRVQASFRLGSALALGLVVVMAVMSSSPSSPMTGPGVDAAENRASVVLANLSQKMDEVRVSVEGGDREKARATSVAAAGALVEAQETAKLLPRGNPVRDRVLAEALNQVQTLQSLVTRLQLEVPPLTPRPAAGATSGTGGQTPSAQNSTTASSSTVNVPASTVITTAAPTTAAPSTTSPPSSTTTTAAPPSSTTTTLSPLVTLPPPQPKTAPPPSTTATTAPAMTTTTTTTAPATTTTTSPAPPPVTTTTVPPTTTTTTTTLPPPPSTPTTAPPAGPTAPMAG